MSILTSLTYDALDRLVAATPIGEATIQSFYNRKNLSTQLQEFRSISIFRSVDCLHAQQRMETNRKSTTLLATDIQRSVLAEIEEVELRSFAYMPYGHRHSVTVMSSLLAFNGERPSAITGHYLLGNGRRAFNPVLMRFNSPDKLSPFDRGWVNAFAYCKGDPINWNDPSGQFFQSILSALKVTQGVLKTGWKSYAVFVRPAEGGLRGVGTLVSRAGYVATAAGWGLQTGGYAVGATVTNVGAVLIGTGKTMKVAHKLVSAVKNGKMTDALRNRVRQFRRQTGPVVLDPEKANTRSAHFE
jgi:RHS repeat-associated protein